MPKDMHFFGRYFEDGKIGRFFGGHDDDEFEAIMKKLDGEQPKGFIAWHIPKDELERGSKRVDKLKTYPFVTAFSPFVHNGVSYADDEETLVRAKEYQLLEEELAEERKNWLWTAAEIKERATERLYERGKEWDVLSIDTLVSKVGNSLQSPEFAKEDKLLNLKIDELIDHLQEVWDMIRKGETE